MRTPSQTKPNQTRSNYAHIHTYVCARTLRHPQIKMLKNEAIILLFKGGSPCSGTYEVLQSSFAGVECRIEQSREWRGLYGLLRQYHTFTFQKHRDDWAVSYNVKRSMGFRVTKSFQMIDDLDQSGRTSSERAKKAQKLGRKEGK